MSCSIHTPRSPPLRGPRGVRRANASMNAFQIPFPRGRRSICDRKRRERTFNAPPTQLAFVDMEVRVRLFAALRERVGAPELVLELPDGALVGDALERLAGVTAG